jgi:hypothetical protein
MPRTRCRAARASRSARKGCLSSWQGNSEPTTGLTFANEESAF